MARGDGPEEKAARLLNRVMVALLAALLAGFATWSVSDYLWSTFALGEAFWRDEVFVRFLNPLALILIALRFRLGSRRAGSRSR